MRELSIACLFRVCLASLVSLSSSKILLDKTLLKQGSKTGDQTRYAKELMFWEGVREYTVTHIGL